MHIIYIYISLSLSGNVHHITYQQLVYHIAYMDTKYPEPNHWSALMTSASHASLQELLAGISPPPVEAVVVLEIWIETLIDVDMDGYGYVS